MQIHADLSLSLMRVLSAPLLPTFMVLFEVLHLKCTVSFRVLHPAELQIIMSFYDLFDPVTQPPQHFFTRQCLKAEGRAPSMQPLDSFPSWSLHCTVRLCQPVSQVLEQAIQGPVTH